MNANFKPALLCLFAFFLSTAPAAAFPVASSAIRDDGKALRTQIFYYGQKNRDLNFQVGGSGACSGGGTTNPGFACGSTGDIDAEGSGDAVVAKISYKPFENFTYYLSAGVGSYSMRVSSISVVNELTGENPGFLASAGLKAVILPEVSAKIGEGLSLRRPGIAVDFGLGWQRYAFNAVSPNAVSGSGGDRSRLDLFETQIAMLASQTFEVDEAVSLQPYGGVKWLGTRVWHKDYNSGDRTGGRKDTIHPFLGLNVPLFKNEAFFAEASFVNGIQYSAGLTVRFKP